MENGRIADKVRVNAQQKKAVKVTSPAPLEVWDQMLSNDAESLAFQTPAWVSALIATGAYTDATRLYEFSNGRCLLLPLVRKTGLPLPLSSDASMPHSWGMGGLVGMENLQAGDMTAVFEDLRRQPVLRTSIRPNPIFARAWEQARPSSVIAKPMLAHVLDLSGGFEEVWAHRFVSETRTAVRKAERSGLHITLDQTGEHIPVFYELFMRSTDRWAQQQNEPIWLSRWRAKKRDPIEKFYTIAKAAGKTFRLWTAWKDGQPAAAILVVQGRNASYTRGAMDKDLAGPTRANQLLHRMAIEQACKEGSRRYHMGESGTSTSLAQFKTRFGAVPMAYAEYVFEKFPITAIDSKLRAVVKRMIHFKDAE
jgi:hypothetical protein